MSTLSSAKQIRIAPIPSKQARAFISRHHYSGNCASAQWLYLGCFAVDRLVGVMSFGRPIDPRKASRLLSGARWDSILELGRMAMIDDTPPNSESRCISVAVRMIAARYPQFELIQSYADASQCGDGTIYRAAGFSLVSIHPNSAIWKHPDGRRLINLTQTEGLRPLSNRGRTSMQIYRDAGFRPIPGFQLRYVRPLSPGVMERLTMPVLPYSEIARRGAGMYKGRPKDSSEPPGLPAGRGRGSTDPDAPEMGYHPD